MPRHLMVKRGDDSPELSSMAADDSYSAPDRLVTLFATTNENLRPLKRSPKKRLFPCESPTVQDENCGRDWPQPQHPRHSPQPGMAAGVQGEPLAHPERITRDSTSVPLHDAKPHRSVQPAPACIDESFSDDRHNLSATQPPGAANQTETPHCTKVRGCSYKTLGVKKKLLLRSGLASYRVVSDLKPSPKRVPLSPMKANTYTNTSITVSPQAKRRVDCSKIKALCSRSPYRLQSDSVSSQQPSPAGVQPSPADLRSSSSVRDRVSLDCATSSYPCVPPAAIVPLYSPISSASESSNVSDVTEPGSTPSSSSCSSSSSYSPEDVTHYTVRTPCSAAGTGTKLTLVRQPRPTLGVAITDTGPTTSTGLTNPSDVQSADPRLGEATGRCQDIPLDMTLKTGQVSSLPWGQSLKSQTSSRKMVELETSLGRHSPSPRMFMHETSSEIRHEDNKENIPPALQQSPPPSHATTTVAATAEATAVTTAAAAVTAVTNSSPRTFTPEPSLSSQPLHKKRNACHGGGVLLARPSTAPPALAEHCQNPAVRLDGGPAAIHTGGGVFPNKQTPGANLLQEDSLPVPEREVKQESEMETGAGGGEQDGHGAHPSAQHGGRGSGIGQRSLWSSSLRSVEIPPSLPGLPPPSVPVPGLPPPPLPGLPPPLAAYGQAPTPTVSLPSTFPLPTGHAPQLPPHYEHAQSQFNVLAYQNLYQQYYGSFHPSDRPCVNLPAPHPLAFHQMPSLPGPSFATNGSLSLHPADHLSDNGLRLAGGDPSEVKREPEDRTDQSSADVQTESRKSPSATAEVVKTEMASDLSSPKAAVSEPRPVEPGPSYLDIPPPTVQVDVVGMDDDNKPVSDTCGQNQRETTDLPVKRARYSQDSSNTDLLSSHADSGIASDFSGNTTEAHQALLSRSDTISPPATAHVDTEEIQTPDPAHNDSACFVTPTQHPPGKALFPNPVGASTPMEDENLWRPWNVSSLHSNRNSDLEENKTSAAALNDKHSPGAENFNVDASTSQGYKRSHSEQLADARRFISPVLPESASRHSKQRRQQLRQACSPTSYPHAPSSSFSIASMLSKDSPAPLNLRESQTRAHGSGQAVSASSSHTAPSSRYPSAHIPPASNAPPYTRLAANRLSAPPSAEGPINLSCHYPPHPPHLQPGRAMLPERLAYTEQFYHNAQYMLHHHPRLPPPPPVSSGQMLPPFVPPHPLVPPHVAMAATFGAEGIPSATQPYHLPGYPYRQPALLPAVSSHSSIPAVGDVSSTTESGALDLSDGRRSASEPALPSPQNPSSSSAVENHTGASPARPSSPRPALQQVNPIRGQPASAQPIQGVVLGTPPAGARPASAFVHTKRLVPKSQLIAAKRNQAQAEEGQAKKRDRPPQFGEEDIQVLEVQFYESPERARFCNANNEFVVPKVPDSRDAQDELRDALSRLYEKSNLPKVPSAFLYNVHALAYYPFMQHLFHLLRVKGLDIYNFKFGAYGQAFENPRLAALGDTEFNSRLDSMCYVGEDNLLHCLVMRHIDNGARCDHVASELGKMRRHAKNHYPEKKWVCCFCRAQMPDLTDMERHTSTHTSLKPFRCIECNKFFSQKVTLGNHMVQHHNKKLHKMDPRKSFTCRQDGCLFQDHQRQACIEHLINHHANDEYIRRSKRGMWPFPPRNRAGAVSTESATPTAPPTDGAASQSDAGETSGDDN